MPELQWQATTEPVGTCKECDQPIHLRAGELQQCIYCDHRQAADHLTVLEPITVPVVDVIELPTNGATVHPYRSLAWRLVMLLLIAGFLAGPTWGLALAILFLLSKLRNKAVNDGRLTFGELEK